MLCLEAWYFQVLVLIAGLLPNPEIALDSLSVCMTIYGWVFMISVGFNAAASVRVSNELGAGNPKSAFFSVWVVTGLSATISTILAVGCGWQQFVAYVNVGSYYIVGVPLGVVLGFFFNLGAKGIWGGLIGGTALQTTILLWVTIRTDWTKEVEEAQKRLNKWDEKKQPLLAGFNDNDK
ncbi:unnamed protein product [Triticum turgidum subsp. durum]|uniref:Protein DETOXIFICATION n=1 Tax=Triticum turgidum subsp. durum TaxID=4567 RepID=A0A9R1R040_TRITD|nr:unnamed protein product [Triticum turgidum subsp. durum]